MPAPEIEISKNGLKLSYQRYMADSAAGFVVILALIFLVSRGIPLPVVGDSLQSLRTLSGPAPLFILLIVFLLATPIGLLINGLGWFLFGWCRIYLAGFWFNLPKKWYNPFFPTQELFHEDKLLDFFGIGKTDKSNRIYKVSESHEYYLAIFFWKNIKLDHVTGLRKLTRNLACLSLMSIIFCLHMTFWYPESIYRTPVMFEVFSTLFFLTMLFTLLYSLLESYLCLKILSTVYLLCIARGISNENPAAPEELIQKIHAAYFGDKEEKFACCQEA
ncbi:MAG: hypothetical protein D3923_17200 [Candidatus Electrothrix sp. AR3]|nr:hypothetical protein [Candidatus Electrothrix sp. AR3]